MRAKAAALYRLKYIQDVVSAEQTTQYFRVNSFLSYSAPRVAVDTCILPTQIVLHCNS